jgi:hypothetical protein
MVHPLAPLLQHRDPIDAAFVGDPQRAHDGGIDRDPRRPPVGDHRAAARSGGPSLG